MTSAEQSVPLGAYVHVPFCASRCGYCDFNTYTADELRKDGTTVSVRNYHQFISSEIAWTKKQMSSARPLSTVFFGGGTPTLLAAKDLVSILSTLTNEFGLIADAEVTTEANPDSVDRDYLAELLAGGFTRISFGHQSSAQHVLKYLDRTHSSGRTWQAVKWAKEVGFEHVSVDLIYGSPVETVDDLRSTLREVIASEVDHVSAYSLIVEPGTRLARIIAQGDVKAPTDDMAATRYPIIDEALAIAGYEWYEVSNWAKPQGRCRHNLGYWKSYEWLGLGPGAHAYVSGIRSWNHKHPARWASAIESGESPWLDHEVLSHDDKAKEHVMLALRLREGISRDRLTPLAQQQAQQASEEGLLVLEGQRWVLTAEGRLWADALVARLWD